MIDINTPRAECVNAGKELGQVIKPFYEGGYYRGICTKFIDLKAIQNMVEVVKFCSKTVSDITKDKKLMRGWLGNRCVAEVMFNAIPEFLTVDVNKVFEYDVVAHRNIQKTAIDICDDFAVFVGYSILTGGDSDMIRRNLNVKTVKALSNLVKKEGHKCIYSRLYRACAAYLALSDKVIEPSLNNLLERERVAKKAIHELPKKTESKITKLQTPAPECFNSFGEALKRAKAK